MTALSFDPLWVPAITHYSAAGRFDAARSRAHIAALAPHVKQLLIAGTTGDGWSMSDETFAGWLEIAAAARAVGSEHAILVGAFGADTQTVIARAQWIEKRLREHPSAARFVGLTLCPPVGERASQGEIIAHFRAIAAATTLPLALYQLPQVTKNEMTPQTFTALAQEIPRIVLFKDTSGCDSVAASGGPTGSARLLRGAEGDYARHLKPNGRYDGWLLSTANCLAPQLRDIANLVAAGQLAQAEALSVKLTALVEKLFSEAGKLGANAFADVNRAGDHIRAYGPDWKSASPPIRFDGSRLPAEFLAFTAQQFDAAGFGVKDGYLETASARG